MRTKRAPSGKFRVINEYGPDPNDWSIVTDHGTLEAAKQHADKVNQKWMQTAPDLDTLRVYDDQGNRVHDESEFKSQ